MAERKSHKGEVREKTSSADASGSPQSCCGEHVGVDVGAGVGVAADVGAGVGLGAVRQAKAWT